MKIMSHPKLNRKKVLAALDGSMGITSAIAQKCGCSRVTLWKWLKKNPKIREMIDQENEGFIDFTEHQLIKRIKDGDTTAIIYALKTKGKHRGWAERLELAGAKDQPIEIEVTEKHDPRAESQS